MEAVLGDTLDASAAMRRQLAQPMALLWLQHSPVNGPSVGWPVVCPSVFAIFYGLSIVHTPAPPI